MIQKAEFDKLQFGDKLAQITENGELYTYKYIGRDPGWENRYAFLSGEDGSSALHYNRDFILSLLQLNPLPKSGCVKPRTYMYSLLLK